MPFHLLVPLFSAAIAFWTVLVVYTAVKCRLARWNFQKISRGLPMPGGIRALDNGTTLWAVKTSLNDYLWTRTKEQWKRRHQEPPTKTIGSLYGTVPMVITTDFDLIRRIRAEPDKHVNRMSTLNLPVYEVENSIFLAKDDEWRRIRNSFAPALKSNKFMKPNVVEEVEGGVEKLVAMLDAKLEDRSKLDRNGGRLVNADDIMHRYTLDQFFSTLYKQNDQINFDERPCTWTDMVDEGVRTFQKSPIIRACLVFPILVPVVEWFIWNFHPQGKWRQKIVKFIQRSTRLGLEARKEVREKLAEGKKFDPDNFTLKDGTQFKRNLLDYVVDHFLDGTLNKSQFFDTSFFLLNAANKTTCDCIVNTFYHIAVNQDVQKKLRQSIAQHGMESEYLEWCINESLRLMPPVSAAYARTLGEDMEIENGRYLLPKGTFVITPTYVIHRLYEYWGEDSEKFRPERWQDADNFDSCQYMPFGMGIRACPGKDLAMFLMRKLFVALLMRYKFQAETKKDLDAYDSPFFFICLPHSPTYVTVQKLQS